MGVPMHFIYVREGNSNAATSFLIDLVFSDHLDIGRINISFDRL